MEQTGLKLFFISFILSNISILVEQTGLIIVLKAGVASVAKGRSIAVKCAKNFKLELELHDPKITTWDTNIQIMILSNREECFLLELI